MPDPTPPGGWEELCWSGQDRAPTLSQAAVPQDWEARG